MAFSGDIRYTNPAKRQHAKILQGQSTCGARLQPTNDCQELKSSVDLHNLGLSLLCWNVKLIQYRFDVSCPAVAWLLEYVAEDALPMPGTSWHICFPISYVPLGFSTKNCCPRSFTQANVGCCFVYVWVSLSCLNIQLEMTVSVPLSIDEKFQRVDLVIEIL